MPIKWSLGLAAFFIAALAGPLRAEPTTAERLQSHVASLSAALERPADRDAIAAFYREREFRPAWFQGGWLSPRARALVHELGLAATWGLDDQEFQLPALTAQGASEPFAAPAIADIDYELSAALLKYALHASGGRIPDPERTLSDFIGRQPILPDPLPVLRAFSTSGHPAEELRALHPNHPQFQRLREAYVAALTMPGRYDGPVLALEGDNLLAGMTHADVAILRKVLNVPASGEDENVFDKPLKSAVMQFQRNHDLGADGVVGPKTREALHHSKGAKLRDIAANMEQWRWMPANLGRKHLIVNIPSFNLKLMEEGAVKLDERVIVGKTETPTPVFSKALSTIVLKPTWFIPDSIKREKLLAAQSRGRSIEDEGYIVKKGNKVIDSTDIDWSEADLKQYTFHQPAGDRNALGDVKFLFPNKYSVYLHDTPSRSLFNSQVRAFSHGCIRLRNPLNFAQYLLDGDGAPGKVNVQKRLDTIGDSTEFTLASPLPIHIAYFTVWANDDGTVETYDDLYGHAERISLKLEGKPAIAPAQMVAANANSELLPKALRTSATDRGTKSYASRDNNEVSSGGAHIIRAPAPSKLGAPPPQSKPVVKASLSSGSGRGPRRNTPGEMMNAAFR